MAPIRTRSQEAIAQAAEEAALLEAAQLQAREEEAIQDRLPREVLNLGRRLELQQQSVESLQGDISKLTTMVAQIGLSLNRSAGAADPSGSNQSGLSFNTPPHHHAQLSPIMEGATPLSAPSANSVSANSVPKTSALPVTTREQMQVTQGTHQNLGQQFQTQPGPYTQQSSSFPMSNPPQTSLPALSNPSHTLPMAQIPPSSQSTNFHQHTSPYHQPQLYQQQPFNTSTYFPSPTTIPSNIPNGPQWGYPIPQTPLPLYSYTPTQPNLHPHWQQYNQPIPNQTYPPPPPPIQQVYPPPIPHQNHYPPPTPIHQPEARAQYNNYNSEPHIRPPSVDLPLFTGDNAMAWIQDCESIFELAGIPQEQKVKWAHAHIRGRAKTWLNSTDFQLYLMNWQQFCSLLCERFPAPGVDESMEQCIQLKQQTTVNQYIDLFEEWMTVMKRDRSTNNSQHKMGGNQYGFRGRTPQIKGKGCHISGCRQTH